MTEEDAILTESIPSLTSSIVASSLLLQQFCGKMVLPIEVKRLLIEMEYQFSQDVQTIMLETLKR